MNRRSQIIESAATPHTQSVLVLSPAQYVAFESKLPKPDPRTTDPVQAGIQLGVQIALQALRAGFVAAK